MTRRRLVLGTAGALGLVLLGGAGLGLAGPGFVRDEPPDAAVRTAAGPVVPVVPVVPVPVVQPTASPVAEPSPSPVVVPSLRPSARPRPSLGSAAQPDLDVASVLGPPPGPEVDRRPERTAPPQDRYAFLFGVADYRAPTTDTIGGARDVQLLRDSLVASGWLPGNVRVVTDAQATGRALRDGMAWLAAKGQPGTFALFHYSGHVKQKGGTREALWPVDRDFVDDTEVTRALSRVRGRLWVDVAGCEAGSFLPGLPSDRVLVSASSQQTEKSYEYPPWGTSVWTGLLFDLGLRQGHADADGDGRTTVGEALRWSTYYAQAVTLGQQPHGRQTPQVQGAGDLGWTLADPPA